MKQFTRLLCVILLCAVLLPNSAMAADVTHSSDIIYLEDGSYITVELTEIATRALSTKTGKKTYTYKNSDGVEEWRAVLTGTFGYTGTHSSCTSSVCDVTITKDTWYVVSKTTNVSGNSALADLTMGRKFIGITVEKESLSMKLTCDVNGNLS